jgi:hypothetical protein
MEELEGPGDEEEDLGCQRDDEENHWGVEDRVKNVHVA